METFKDTLTPEEERNLMDRLAAGDEEAGKLLVEHNLRLVAHIVKKYGQNEHDIDDLISIGTIGLIKAVNTFKISKGNRLATYASRCIENELLMHFRGEKKRSREVSLNEPIGTDKEGNVISLFDVIEGENEDYAERYENNKNVLWVLKNAADILSNREYYIIRKRYGLMGEPEMAQRELAKELGISRSYVSRLESKALNKLRDGLEKR